MTQPGYTLSSNEHDRQGGRRAAVHGGLGAWPLHVFYTRCQRRSHLHLENKYEKREVKALLRAASCCVILRCSGEAPGGCNTRGP
jgi:hypothetical protein